MAFFDHKNEASCSPKKASGWIYQIDGYLRDATGIGVSLGKFKKTLLLFGKSKVMI